MNDLVVVVNELTVHVVTGAASEDPYGQGFSAIYADSVVVDKVSVDLLIEAKARRASVTLRCAMLDVRGPITKVVAGAQAHEFVVAIDGMTYRKPQSTGKG